MTGQLALLLVTASDLVTRLRAFGLPRATAVALHANRRVMVSLDRGGCFRVHRGYAFAPDQVIAALAEWARPRLPRGQRRAAARVLLDFQAGAFVPPPPPRRRVKEPVLPGDEVRLAKLQALHQGLNEQWFEAALPSIRIGLSGRMRRKLGHYEPRSEGEPAIVISRQHLRRDGWVPVADTLLHEMVHQWQDQNGLTVDHRATFRRKAREVGIRPSAMTVLDRSPGSFAINGFGAGSPRAAAGVALPNIPN